MPPVKIPCDLDSYLGSADGDSEPFCKTFHNHKMAELTIGRVKGLVADHQAIGAMLRFKYSLQYFYFNGDCCNFYGHFIVHQGAQKFSKTSNNFVIQLFGSQFQVKVRPQKCFRVKRLPAPYETNCRDYGPSMDGILRTREDCINTCVRLTFYDRYCEQYNCSASQVNLFERLEKAAEGIDDFRRLTKLTREGNQAWDSLIRDCDQECSYMDCDETRVQFDLIDFRELNPIHR